MNSLTVITEGSHPMASSNTKDKNIFRLANGNYISRMAYVHMLSVDNKANNAEEILSVMKDLEKLGKGFSYIVRGVEVSK